MLDLDARPWAELDGPSLASSAAALQLLPENIPCLLRAQRLAAIGAALPARRAAPPLSPSRLRAVLKHPLIAGPDVLSQEDPYEEVFVEEVAFHGGPRLVLQGLTNHSAHTARVLLTAIFGSAGGGLPGEYVRQARLLASLVLWLSHVICSAARLRRGVTTTEVQRRELFVPSSARLGELRAALTFTAADLDSLLPGGYQQALDGWITDAGAHRVTLEDSTDDGLILRPLLRQGTDLIVVNPGELMSALRHHLIVMAAGHGCREVLGDAFRQTAAAMTGDLLSEMGAVPRSAPMPAADPLVLRQGFDGVADTIIDVGVLTDELADYDPANPFGRWNIPNAGQPLQDCLDPPGPPDANDDRTLRLAVTDDVARTRLIALEPPRRPGPLLTVPLNELQVMISMDAGDPLFLWRYAQASDRFHKDTLVQEFSVLDTYAIYRDNQYSFYLNDRKPPMMVTVTPGSGARLRAEAQRRHDRHHIPGPDGLALVEVMSLYGTDTAPIYFPHPRYETWALAVELPDTTAWVLQDTAANEAVRGFLFSMMEAVAYWIWQLGGADPGLLAAAGPGGRLRVVVAADDSSRWNHLLAEGIPGHHGGGQDDDAAADGSWVIASTSSPGETSVAVLADHAMVLRSRSNLADRQLVAALARALAPPRTAPAQIDALIGRIAPAGPKRMIRIVRSSDVMLMPADVPARAVQPAVTATVLDDLGQWLVGQGLSTGPIQPSDRTKVLGQAVDYYYKRLVETVAELSPEGLMAFLVAQNEALLHDSAIRDQRLPSQLACFGSENVHARHLLTAERNGVEAAVASRFLVEYAAAKPPAGNRTINLMIYDELLALAAELISRAMLSDAIHYEFSQVQLSMLPSGRLGVSRGDRYSAGTEALAMTTAEARRALALGPAPGTDTPPAIIGQVSSAPATPVQTRVDEAMHAEFGFTLTQVIDGLHELAAQSAERGTGPCLEQADQVRARLKDGLGWDEAAAEAFLDKLTLRPRSEFLSPRADAYPWRYNRNLSYFRRPMIEVTGPAGEPLLMWGARRAWYAARYWAEVIFTGRLKANSPAMTKLMGTIRQDQNKAFERQVAVVLGQAGMPITASAVKQISGRRLLSAGGDLGDIDAIALDPVGKIIIVAEAKDFELARTPAELANEAEDLLTGDKSAARKLGRRANWVRCNLALVRRQFGVGGNPAGWRVLPVIVTSRNLLSPRILEARIPVRTLDDLASWVGQQRPQRQRR